jgi:hypothetical protein
LPSTALFAFSKPAVVKSSSFPLVELPPFEPPQAASAAALRARPIANPHLDAFKGFLLETQRRSI